MTQQELATIKEALLNASCCLDRLPQWQKINERALKIVTQEQLKENTDDKLLATNRQLQAI